MCMCLASEGGVGHVRGMQSGAAYSGGQLLTTFPCQLTLPAASLSPHSHPPSPSRQPGQLLPPRQHDRGAAEARTQPGVAVSPRRGGEKASAADDDN